MSVELFGSGAAAAAGRGGHIDGNDQPTCKVRGTIQDIVMYNINNGIFGSLVVNVAH